ncbi:alpha/beta fold hydrolase [Streptomyces sp. NPDC050610]|uniref:thioesterase II family protein n=1 Tax=Streptomyces sp. NPDC050610 TaxID=3157097 RepID=UPI0034219610
MTSLPADSGLWCRRFHPSPAATSRLVCFPHAGGSASFYFPVSGELRGRTEVLAVQYPGRQDRRAEPTIGDLRVLADEVFEALSGWTGLPLTFFGHSMGALVAFEVARRFEGAGQGVEHLFVSGRRGPAVPHEERLHLRNDDGIVAAVREMSGTDESLLDDEELVRMMLPALRGDFRAVETYRGEADAVLRCPITALAGDQDPRAPLDEVREWKAHTSAAFDFKVFPGGHFYLTSRPADVMNVLRDHFDR